MNVKQNETARAPHSMFVLWEEEQELERNDNGVTSDSSTASRRVVGRQNAEPYFYQQSKRSSSLRGDGRFYPDLCLPGRDDINMYSHQIRHCDRAERDKIVETVRPSSLFPARCFSDIDMAAMVTSSQFCAAGGIEHKATMNPKKKVWRGDEDEFSYNVKLRAGNDLEIDDTIPFMIDSEGSSTYFSSGEDDSWKSNPPYGEDQPYCGVDLDHFSKAGGGVQHSTRPDFCDQVQASSPPEKSSTFCMSQPSPQKSIEIAPGQYIPLRGADETWRAIRCDFFVPIECACCCNTIFCIENAEYVLCPDCRVVSLLHDGEKTNVGGVGLGFKMEDLAQWQEEIALERSHS